MLPRQVPWKPRALRPPGSGLHQHEAEYTARPAVVWLASLFVRLSPIRPSLHVVPWLIRQGSWVLLVVTDGRLAVPPPGLLPTQIQALM